MQNTQAQQPSPAVLAQLKPDWRSLVRNGAIALIIAALLAWSYHPAEVFNWVSLITDSANMAEYISGFLEPEWIDLDIFVNEMLVTVNIAVWGTFLSIVLGVPFALLSSNNIAPVWIVQPVRRLMDAFRAINDLVFAMLFVAAVGLGPFAGVMALFIHNTGIIAKLFSEAVEAIDPRPVEGIRATGAGRLQEIIYGVIPQVIPLWSSYSLYRFETNVRSATVLGIVGAGGIGHVLWESIRAFEYGRTAAIMIVIVLTVTVIDLVSSHLRRVLV